MLRRHFKRYKNRLKELSKDVDLVILDHPSAAALIEDLEDVPIVFNSHNCEITMAKQLYPENKDMLEIVEKMEGIALSKAIGTSYCSEKDFKEIKEHYSYSKNDIYIPNGTTMQKQSDPDVRTNSKTILFVGSGHKPNSLAALNLIPIANIFPEYDFVVCGGSSFSLNKSKIPSNLIPRGEVSDEELDHLFKTSYAFINPMESGSGTHLKMMKALSYGIPIITSSFGARGFSKDRIKKSMLIAESVDEYKKVFALLKNKKNYETLCLNGHSISKEYDWEKIKKDYAKWIDSILLDLDKINKKEKVKLQINKKNTSQHKKKVLIYSIIRNNAKHITRYHTQLKTIVKDNPEIEFYLSIYENDSDDGTQSEILNKDWSFFNGVSIVSEKINTKLFGSVKNGERTENLAKARDKGISGGGFINKVDYVLMVEGDIKYNPLLVKDLFNFNKKEPDFDIVSAVSLRRNGTHYDWWATRTSAIFVSERSELDPEWDKKDYGRYYSTSNGLCLYRAKPFQDGIKHHWINTVTKEADCEMVVLCQNFQNAGYKNIYILYSVKSHNA